MSFKFWYPETKGSPKKATTEAWTQLSIHQNMTFTLKNGHRSHDSAKKSENGKVVDTFSGTFEIVEENDFEIYLSLNLAAKTQHNLTRGTTEEEAIDENDFCSFKIVKAQDWTREEAERVQTAVLAESWTQEPALWF